MDFITILPRTSRQHDSIIGVVDKLNKVAHLIPLKSSNLVGNVAWVFIREIVIFHGVPKKIISDKDMKFTSRFWKVLFASLGIELNFNIAYHAHIDGQPKRLRRFLRIC